MNKPDDSAPLDQQIDSRVRTLFADAEPSVELWQRIRKTSRENQRGQSATLWRASLSIAALVLVAITVVAVMPRHSLPGGATPFSTTLIDELHTFQVSGRTLDVAETNPSKLQRWFVPKIGFQPPPPPTSATPANLVGGRLCHIENHRTVSYMYDVAGSTLSLFITNRRDLGANIKHRELARQRGYGHVSWQVDDIQFHLVGAVPNDTLRSVANVFEQSTRLQNNEIPKSGNVL